MARCAENEADVSSSRHSAFKDESGAACGKQSKLGLARYGSKQSGRDSTSDIVAARFLMTLFPLAAAIEYSYSKTINREHAQALIIQRA